MVKARLKFHSEHDASCVLYKNNFLYELRAKFAPKIENPIADNDYLSVFQEGKKLWKHVGDEKVWVTRPQFHHWKAKIFTTGIAKLRSCGCMSANPHSFPAFPSPLKASGV